MTRSATPAGFFEQPATARHVTARYTNFRITLFL
jgi:hypothetical protein